DLHVFLHLHPQRDGGGRLFRRDHADDHRGDHGALPLCRTEGEEVMSAVTQDSAVSTGRITRAFIYLVLLLFALFYLLPLYVMAVSSVKPLAEITGGNMMALPRDWTLAPSASAWSTAQIGVSPTGLKPYFLNSILMVVPAVAISTIVG